MKVLDMFEAFVQTTKDRVLPLEGIRPEEKLKDGRFFVTSSLPVRVGHGDLIQIREKSRHEWIGGWWELRPVLVLRVVHGGCCVSKGGRNGSVCSPKRTRSDD